MRTIFHIREFAEEDARKLAMAENEPHQHDFEELAHRNGGVA